MVDWRGAVSKSGADPYEKFLCDQTFKFAEWVSLEDSSHLLSSFGLARAKDQIAARFEKGPGR